MRFLRWLLRIPSPSRSRASGMWTEGFERTHREALDAVRAALAEHARQIEELPPLPAWVIPPYLEPTLLLGPGDTIEVSGRRYRVVDARTSPDGRGTTLVVEPFNAPDVDAPRCGALSPTGVRQCKLNPGHHGRHGHAPEGTADWTTWEPTR